MHPFLKTMNQRGYTLIESLFQLVVFIAFTQLFILFFFWKAPIESQYTSMANTAWELFVLDFQADLIDVDRVTVYPDHQGIQFVKARGVIDIDERNHVIRRRVDGQGHVPYLTDIETAHFSMEDRKLVVHVTMRDGSRKERDFIVGLNPK